MATIGEHAVGFLAWATTPACGGAGVEIFEQWDQPGEVVAIGAGQADRQGNAARLDQKTVLLSPCGHGPPGMASSGAPKRARMWLPSTDARDQSIFPAAFSFTSSLR